MQTCIHQYATGTYKSVSSNIRNIGVYNFVDANKLLAHTNLLMAIFMNINKFVYANNL